jgi:hypothetical protein
VKPGDPITLIAVTLLLVLVVGRLLHSGSPRNADYKRSWLANRSWTIRRFVQSTTAIKAPVTTSSELLLQICRPRVVGLRGGERAMAPPNEKQSPRYLPVPSIRSRPLQSMASEPSG